MFHEKAQKAVSLGLDALFASQEEPKPPLMGLLGLVWILRSDEGCPNAAKVLLAAITAHDQARRLLGITGGNEAYLEKAKMFVAGRGTRALAPKVGSKAPKGALKLSDIAPLSALIRRR